MKLPFSALGFDKCFFVKNKKNIANYFEKNQHCGIYILHFENEEYYVGLAINVVKRYAQHKQKYSDIEYLSFKKADLKDLVKLEKETIYELENQKKVLRNINLVSIIKNKTNFDNLITKDLQKEWLKIIEADDYFEKYTNLEIFNYEELRKKYTNKFKKLQKSLYFEKIIAILQVYVFLTLPYPHKTMYHFWVCTALPSNGNIFSRINIFWQETLRIYEQKYTWEENDIEVSEKEIEICIWLSKSILFAHYSTQELQEKYISLEIGEAIYQTGGQDQEQITISLFDFYDFMGDEIICKAIKDFNLRLMRKGNCIFGRYHCFDLANEILEIK